MRRSRPSPSSSSARQAAFPVFAHPVASARGRVVGEGTYRDMIDAGLAGLEVDHRDNPEEGREFLRRLAAKHGLLVTGSSDYHGTGKPNRLGEYLTAPEVFARIEELGAGTPSSANIRTDSQLRRFGPSKRTGRA